jgi:hypothetical protein
MCLLAVGSSAACVQKESVTSGFKARPLAATDYRAELALAQPAPRTSKPRARVRFLIRVRNSGNGVFPHLPSGPARGDAVLLSYHILSAGTGEVLVFDGARAALPYDLPAGGTVELPLEVTLPDTPGLYSIQFDLVHEEITWFANQHSAVLTTPVTVD